MCLKGKKSSRDRSRPLLRKPRRPQRKRNWRERGKSVMLEKSIEYVDRSSAEHIVWRYIVIPNIVSFSKYRINIVIAFFLDNITRYCMHVILVYFSLSWTCESKMTFKISYGLTYNSMNWSNLCICYTFEEWNFVYCTVFSRISRKCRNFCDLRAYFTKWEISCNIVWLSYQNPKYRVISCGP